MVARQKQVRCVVWTKAAEQPASLQARPTARVERAAGLLIKGDWAFEGQPLAKLRSLPQKGTTQGK